MKNSQRASETQSVRSIKQSISAIKKEMSPVPTVRPCGNNPKARPLTKSTWVRRVVRVAKPATTSPVNVSVDEIATVLGATGTESYNVKVLDIKAWNVTGPALTSNAIQLQVAATALITGAATLQGEDYGSGSVLAGVHINIPDVLSLVNNTSNNNAICTISNPLGGTNAQSYIVDVTLVMQM